MAETAQEHRLRPIEKIGYGLGDTASNIVFQTVMLLLAYFYTDIFGISAAAMGTLFLAVRVLDAITDPMMGALCDRTQTRWGKFRPYLLWLCLPFAIISILTFTTPDLSSTGKLIYAYITYSLLMLVYTAINIPYCALGGVLTPDTRERVSLNGYRFFLATAGGVLVASATLPLTKLLGQGDDQKGYQLAMTVFSILGVFFFITCFLLTKERVTQATSTARASLGKDIKLLIANDQFLVVALLNFVLLIPLAIRMGAAAYYMKWFAQREDLITPFLTTGMVAMMLGAGCASTLTKYLSKVKAYMLLQIFAMIFSASLFFLKPGQLTWMFVLFAAVQFFVQMGAPILWTMMADTVDYGEYKTERRITGLVFSGSLFSLKMGVALGGAILGWVLAHYGYQEKATEQTPATIRGIALLFTVVPAAIHLLLVGLVNLYKLDQNRCDQIRAALDERSHTASTETRANSEL